MISIGIKCKKYFENVYKILNKPYKLYLYTFKTHNNPTSSSSFVTQQYTHNIALCIDIVARYFSIKCHNDSVKTTQLYKINDVLLGNLFVK